MRQFVLVFLVVQFERSTVVRWSSFFKPSCLGAGIPGYPLGSLSSNEALAAVEVALGFEVVRAAEKHVGQA